MDQSDVIEAYSGKKNLEYACEHIEINLQGSDYLKQTNSTPKKITNDIDWSIDDIQVVRIIGDETDPSNYVSESLPVIFERLDSESAEISPERKIK